MPPGLRWSRTLAKASSVNRNDSRRMLAAVLTRVSESGSAKTTRSYCLSVVRRNARPSLTIARHARVVVGVVGVLLDADALDGGVDLDRVDVLGAVGRARWPRPSRCRRRR